MDRSDSVLRSQTLDELQGFWPERSREELDAKLVPILRSEEWRAVKEHTPESLLNFYENTEELIFDLLAIRTIPEELDKARLIVEHCKTYNCSNVVDYGGGVGADSIPLAKAGLKVTLVDVGKTLACAQYRIKYHNVEDGMRAIRPEEFDWNTHYDAANVMEFWEHVVDPIEWAYKFYDILAPKGILITNTTSFGPHDTGHLPQHYHYSHYSNPQGDSFDLELIKIGYKLVWAEPNLYSMKIFQAV